MPRHFDGIPPERPAGNELPERIADLLDRVLGSLDRPGDRPHFIDQFDFNFPRFDGGPVHDHSGLGSLGQAGDGGPVVQNWHDLNPNAGDAKAAPVSTTDGGAAGLHFEPEGDFNRHVDHYNSQALSLHPDWFML